MKRPARGRRRRFACGLFGEQIAFCVVARLDDDGNTRIEHARDLGDAPGAGVREKEIRTSAV
jgi:hypothetical protein